jgi:hypothetical protein
MHCQRQSDLEKAVQGLTQAVHELKNILKQPDEPVSNSAIEQALGHDTDQAIRDTHHDAQLTLIRTSQELEHHNLTCVTCLQKE